MRKKNVLYRICNPYGAIYIGQSKEFERRMSFYRRGHAKNQVLLNNSFIKYGFMNHTVDVISEYPDDISQESFDNQEKIYIEIYKSAGIRMLNIKEGGRSGKFPAYSKKKMSESSKGQTPHNKGVPHSLEQRKKMSDARKKRIITPETAKKLSLALKGKTKSEEHKRNLSISLKGNTNKKRRLDVLSQ